MTLKRRMTLTVAVACVLTSTVIYQLFDGSAWFYAGIGAVITVAACGALGRMRTLPVVVCLAIGVIGLLLYLNVVFEARHSWLVIPTPDSIRRLWDLAGAGVTDSRRYAPPAPVRPGLVLLAASGIGITALFADLIAVRLRSAALAGLPLLVLFTVPITMNEQHDTVGTAVVFCLATAGYLAMLSADGQERIRVWGALVSLWRSGSLTGTAARPAPRRITGREAGPDTRALAAAGRRVGLASVVLALCVPLIVPGLHASKLFSSGPGIGGSGGSGGGTAQALPDTLQQTLRELQQNSRPTKVLTYTITAPAQLMADGPPYLQTYVYDNLTDSGQWTGDFTSGESSADTMPLPPGLTGPASYPRFTIAVNVAGDALTSRSLSTFLAIPYPAAAVTTPPGTWLVDPELMVFSAGSAADARTYQATSLAVDPTSAELNAAPRPPAGLSADLALPASFKAPALKQIADEITAGLTTEYAKVNALAAWLSGSQFTYSASAPFFNSAAGLYNYLTKGHAGVCVQSAYAMTVLTRLLGIPARMTGGFTGGTHVSGDTYEVKTDDAHAWAEVYFTGYGWVKFEATPGGGDGTARAANYQTAAAGSGTGLQANGGGGPTPGPTASSAVPGGGVKKLQPDEGAGTAGGQPAGSAGTPWTAIALAVLAAIALACGVIAIVAPPAQRVLSAQPADGARRRAVSLPAAALVAAAAAIVALALYRLLSRTSGLNLGAGWATVSVAFGVAGAVAVVVPGVSRIARRRWRWIRAGDDAGRAHAAWREFRDDLQDLGVGYAPSEPPRTLADRVSAELPGPARDAVRSLALAEERACYAARPSGSQTLRRDGAAARRAIAAAAGRGRRWRARIFPASVLIAVADGATRIPDRVAELISRGRAERRSPS
jgi:transglutaminase-like putative cysteine protease